MGRGVLVNSPKYQAKSKLSGPRMGPQKFLLSRADSDCHVIFQMGLIRASPLLTSVCGLSFLMGHEIGWSGVQTTLLGQLRAASQSGPSLPTAFQHERPQGLRRGRWRAQTHRPL